MERMILATNVTSETLLHVNTTSAPQHSYDGTGALWFIVAVVMLYGSAIIFMLGSATRRHGNYSTDAQVGRYLEGLTEARMLGERQHRGFHTRRFSTVKIYPVNGLNVKESVKKVFPSPSTSNMDSIEEGDNNSQVELNNFDPPSFEEVISTEIEMEEFSVDTSTIDTDAVSNETTSNGTCAVEMSNDRENHGFVSELSDGSSSEVEV